MPFPTVDNDMISPETRSFNGDLLSTQIASASSELVFTGSISGTYNQYLIVIDSIVFSNAGTALRIQLSSDDGATYISGASDYGYNIHFTASSGAHSTSASLASSYMSIATNFGIETADHVNGYARLYGVNASGKTTDYEGIIVHGNSGSSSVMRAASLGTLFADTSIINAFRIYPTAGTFTTGTIKLYGIK